MKKRRPKRTHRMPADEFSDDSKILFKLTPLLAHINGNRSLGPDFVGFLFDSNLKLTEPIVDFLGTLDLEPFDHEHGPNDDPNCGWRGWHAAIIERSEAVRLLQMIPGNEDGAENMRGNSSGDFTTLVLGENGSSIFRMTVEKWEEILGHFACDGSCGAGAHATPIFVNTKTNPKSNLLN